VRCRALTRPHGTTLSAPSSLIPAQTIRGGHHRYSAAAGCCCESFTPPVKAEKTKRVIGASTATAPPWVLTMVKGQFSFTFLVFCFFGKFVDNGCVSFKEGKR
jgi:hypothetical protein